jgi:hypothetical protein
MAAKREPPAPPFDSDGSGKLSPLKVFRISGMLSPIDYSPNGLAKPL